MAISQIAPTLGAGSEYDLEAVSTWANTNAFGRDRCSLTEWDTTTIPEVAQGSIIETGGSLYEITTDTSITVGAVSDGYVYIIFDNTTGTENFYLTNTAPTWDPAKFGYYDTGTNYKVLDFEMYKSGSTYLTKGKYSLKTQVFGDNANISFLCQHSGSGSFAASLTTPITGWSTPTYNYGNCFISTTGVFTTTVKGLYIISGNFNGTTTNNIGCGLVYNSTSLPRYDASYETYSIYRQNVSTPILLNIGDTIHMGVTSSSGGGVFSPTTATHFTGCLIKALP